jgi:hypothetical protein
MSKNNFLLIAINETEFINFKLMIRNSHEVMK